jgi:pyrroline-5-carboxylate reductase
MEANNQKIIVLACSGASNTGAYSDKAARKLMAKGSAMTMNESGLLPGEVMDLIPVKPLGEEEENIKSVYHTKLEALFDKSKS